MRIELGDYVLEADSERTKITYRDIVTGGAEGCGCSYCRNYLATLPQALPNEVLAFFAKSGIDPRKDAEVYEQGPISPGVRSYGGEYYLWGAVVVEPKKKQVLSKGFEFAFVPPSPLAQEQFRGEGSLCFHFDAELPWVLEEDV